MLNAALPLVVPPVIVAGLAFLEVLTAFSGVRAIWGTCKLLLLLGCAAFGALGILGYGLLHAVRDTVPVTVASQPISDLGVAIAAVLLVQAGRVETPFKEALPGLPQIAGSLESFYAKGLRLWLSEMFVSLVKGMPHDSGHRALLRRSLASSYSLNELVREFKGWCESLQDPRKTEMLAWLTEVEGGKNQSDASKRSSIAARLIEEDNALTRELAANRANTIVQLRGWRK